MGDGIQKKYAIIVNGDTEERHLGNVDRAIQALRSEGNYEISVASTKTPNAKADHFATADDAGLESLLAGMKGNMDDDDLLVVYFTGHGGADKEDEGCVQLTQSCVSLNSLARQLKALPYGNRILVMDACFSGSGFNQFTDPKTTVVSQGSPGETVSCQNFSPFFWSSQVPDADGDGKVSIQERFQFAVQQGKSASLLQYFSPMPIAFSGDIAARPFKTPDDKPVEARNGTELETQLKRLKPGQVALVDFGADWCVPCKNYQPFFEKLAQQDRGKILMIHAEGQKGSEEDWAKYGIKRYPTVAFIDWNGKVLEVSDPKDPMASLAVASVNSAEDQAKIFSSKLKSTNSEERRNAALGLAGMGPKAASQIPALAQGLVDQVPEVRLACLQALAQIGEASASALPKILPLLTQGDLDMKIAALKAIAAIGPQAGSALPDLLATLRGDLTKAAEVKFPTTGLRPEQKQDFIYENTMKLSRALTAALAKVSSGDPRVLRAYLALLEEPEKDYWHRHTAIEGMGLLKGGLDKEVLALIPSLAVDKEVLYATISIGQIAKQSPQAVGVLVDFVADPAHAPMLRFQIIRELVHSEVKSQILLSCLKKIADDKDEDPRLRKFCAQTLSQIDPVRAAAMAPILSELNAVSLQFGKEDYLAKSASKPRPWSWDSGLQFNGRTGAWGGGMSFGVAYRFTDRFELRLDGSASGMAVKKDKKDVPDFQWGLSAQPKLQVLGKADATSLGVGLGELGFYHLVGAGVFDAYLVPVGLDFKLQVMEDSQLGLSLKPQIHYDGDIKPGGAASLVWKGKF